MPARAHEVPKRRIEAGRNWRGGSASGRTIDEDRRPPAPGFRTFNLVATRAGDLRVGLAPLPLPPLADG